MSVAVMPPELEQAREVVAREWEAYNPVTPEDVARFYRENAALMDELEAWHATPERQSWTAIAARIAGQVKARVVVDVGCGLGHDLAGIRASMPEERDLVLWGVEPNRAMRERLARGSIGMSICDDVACAPIERADLILCFDVLEHLPDPIAFLRGFAARAKMGAVLIETCAPDEIANPLHLPVNRTFHPGAWLESLGYELLDKQGRFHVWQRARAHVLPRASALLCAYRACSIPTMESLARLRTAGWRVRTKYGDGLISRARSQIASRWYLETADDVFLMVDDDITFRPESADEIAEDCRRVRGIVGAAYAVRSGGHLALRGLTGDPIRFGPDAPLTEVRWVSTGFMAVHRTVLDELIKTMPFCHANMLEGFWPFFAPQIIEDEPSGGHAYLSEDWAFNERAREAGFKSWLNPAIKLGHLGQIEITVENMDAIFGATDGFASI